MGKKDVRVDAYIENAEPFAGPILQHIRKVVHAGCPDVEETMKWSFPHFTYHGILCGMAAFTQHCAFGFWKGSLLKDGGDKGSEAMGQFGRITSIDDLPSERDLIRLVKQAAALNEQGVKTPKQRKPELPRPPAKGPSELMAALRRNKQALAAFKAFSPSHQREYIQWIAEAKREETRKRRLEAAVQWMAEGKPRNWKYMTR